MKASGYSGKPLITKLDYSPGSTVLTIDASDSFENYLFGEGVQITNVLPADWIHIFCQSQAQLDVFLKASDLSLIKKGFWVSWPKKTSGMVTDIDEQVIRDEVLPHGWVDTKVCAIDPTWSALKFLRRKNNVDAPAV